MTSVSGFTLVEVLVVLALTIVLLSLLFVPLIQAFRFTAQAQATAQAQDSARSTTEQLTRELGSAAGVLDDSMQYLDLPIMNQSGQQVICRAYESYIDIVPPRPRIGTYIDPTVDPVNPTKNLTNGGETDADLYLPLASGTTVIRYFIGLHYPIDPKYVLGTAPNTFTAPVTPPAAQPKFSTPGDPQPYTNRYEGMNPQDEFESSYVGQQNLNNTYILYRAAYQSSQQIGTTTPATYGPNSKLFPTVNGAAYLNDPDFFRIVRTKETDNVPGQGDGGVYTTATAKAHNDRVYNWTTIAKPVLPTTNVDLVSFTRGGGNKVIYNQSGGYLDGLPVSSLDTDGVTPVVRTSVNFGPGLVPNDPLAPTVADDASQGYGSNPIETSATTSYIPAAYQSAYGSWEGVPTIDITKPGATTTTQFETRMLAASDVGEALTAPNYTTTGQSKTVAGDLVLYDIGPSPAVAVYDVTAGAPIMITSGSTETYDALSFNATSGTVSFAIPALEKPSLATQPYWNCTMGGGGTSNGVNPNQINLNQIYKYTFPSSPGSTATATPLATVPNARLVVNSERVMGPDMTAAVLSTAPTDTVPFVQYTRVPLATDVAANEYSVDYDTGILTFYAQSPPPYVQVAFYYQNNLNTAVQPSNPDVVHATYYSASTVRLNLGIRVYDPSTGEQQFFALNSRVGVGNARA